MKWTWHHSMLASEEVSIFSRLRVVLLQLISIPRWRHQLETFSALLAICAGNSPVTGEFHAQRPVTRSFDVFFDLSLNARMSKQSRGWWYGTPSRPLWRHCNDTMEQSTLLTCQRVSMLCSHGFQCNVCNSWPAKLVSDNCHGTSLIISQHWVS